MQTQAPSTAFLPRSPGAGVCAGRVLAGICLAAASLSPWHAPAAEPTTTPTLRVEAGMHTAKIGRVSTDAAGRIVLTCSDDKTARLWGLERGAQVYGGVAGGSAVRATSLRTLRIPIGEGDEGKLYSCALSPDGTIAAVGGWSGYEWDGSSCIYLFDTATGHMVKRLSGLPNMVSQLVFSSSGQMLAAGLGGKGGIRLWTMANGELAGKDEAYGSDVYGVDWYGDKSLATTMAKHPFGLCYSPDGREVAVSFEDAITVAIFSTKDLSLVHRPSDLGVSGGNLSRLAWSSYGNILAAGGKWAVAATGGRPIRLWSQGGRGGLLDVSSARQTIMDLKALPGGGFLFASGDPAWGVLNRLNVENPRPVMLGPCPVADFRNAGDGLCLSPDGSVVGFGFSYFAQIPASFSVADRRLALRALPTALRPPRLDGMGVTDWQESTSPKYMGQPLRLGAYEISRSMAMAADNSFFMLGCDWSLRCYGANGRERWAVPTPGACWGVNLTADARVVVAAYADGTIRWYRSDTGHELLSFFPHADRKRWALWAPHYDVISYARVGASLSSTEKGLEGRIMITTVQPDSPALAAGLRAGDEILSVGGVTPKTVPDAVNIIKNHKPGEQVALEYRRGQEAWRVTVTLAKSPESLRLPLGAYYDCSADGESLIGWHVNQGKDREADFFPAGQFRDQFYRPDVIQRVLTELDVGRALAAANAAAGRQEEPVVKIEEVMAQMRPPVVELRVGGAAAQIESEGEAITVNYVVRQGSSELTRMRALVDGRPLEKDLPIPAGEAEEATASLPVPAQDCVVTLLAENRTSVSSPVTLRVVRWKPAVSEVADTAPAPEPPPPKLEAIPAPLKPKLYLLSVGIADYLAENQLPDLRYAGKDAKDFAAALARQEGGLYQKVDARVLTDTEATAANLLDGLDWIRQETTSKDVAVVFLSGHGENDEELRYFFCPHDYDPKRRLRTGLSMEEIQKTLARVPGKVLFFIDSCHAGNALGKLYATKGVGGVDITRVVNELSSAENGAVVFASSTGRQLSIESEEWQNGAFTKALVEGLDGEADLLRNGKITVSTLEAWVAERVKELSKGQQSPTVAKPQTIPDFPVAVRR